MWKITLFVNNLVELKNLFIFAKIKLFEFTMIFFPNCKINIGLFVTGKREDGFHNLESVFYPLTLCDALEMRINDKTNTEFSLSGIGVEENFVSKDENNSVLKAYYLLRKDYPNIKDVKIHLDKGIPCFAGLGGGSSDGTFALQLTDFMFDLHLSKEQLYYYASLLGSDNFFFLENKPKFVYGRGEKMQDIALTLHGYYIVLVKPNLNISTKEAYQNVHISKSNFNLRELSEKDIYNWKNYLRNDFEESLFEKYPVLKETKAMLYDNGAIYSQMSGSGATVFGIFENEIDLQKIKRDTNTFIYQEKLK